MGEPDAWTGLKQCVKNMVIMTHIKLFEFQSRKTWKARDLPGKLITED